MTGLCHTDLMLDPLTDAAVASTLGAAVSAEQANGAAERTLNQVKADALVKLMSGEHRVADRGTPDVSVLIDLETLRHSLHDQSVCETSTGEDLPVEAIRRLCCQADIVPVVLDGDGVALDVGRARRVATRDQRRALRAMYRACAHPGCAVGFDDCDIHHVRPWQRGGGTDVANLLPLCSRHHHLVHEGGWTLTLHADRRIELRRPDGSLYFEGSTVDVVPTGLTVVSDDVEEFPGDEDVRWVECLNGITHSPEEIDEPRPPRLHPPPRTRSTGTRRMIGEPGTFWLWTCAHRRAIVVTMIARVVAKVLSAPARRGLVRLRVEGIENLPAEGPAIIAANHLSFFDSVLLLFDLPRRGVRARQGGVHRPADHRMAVLRRRHDPRTS